MTIMKTHLILATVSALALTACEPTQFQNKAQQGAATGAAAGALFGFITGNNPKQKRKKAIVGAIVGGAAGGLIGAQLDAQAKDLKSNLSNDRIKIINTGSELIVRMPQDILFDTDSTLVAKPIRKDLKALALNLQKYPGSTVEVIGHTDSVGSAAYNLDLSRRRAEAVAQILVAKGVDAGRIVIIGKGESEPIATNYTPEGRAQNRRVEIVIRPNTQG